MPKCQYAHPVKCAPFQREDRYCGCCPADVEGHAAWEAEYHARLAKIVADMTPEQRATLAEALKQIQSN